MKTIYTVYQLNEKVNKFGNPYIGMTDNLLRRSKRWKNKLKLDYTPNLIPLHTDTNQQRTFDWEQNKRVENGWSRERSLRHLRKITKKANDSVRAKKSWKKAQEASPIGKQVLSIEQVEEIRMLYKPRHKEFSQLALSIKYNVHHMTIFNIINNKFNYTFTSTSKPSNCAAATPSSIKPALSTSR